MTNVKGYIQITVLLAVLGIMTLALLGGAFATGNQNIRTYTNYCTPTPTPTLEPTVIPEPSVTPEITPTPQESHPSVDGVPSPETGSEPKHDNPVCTKEVKKTVANFHIYRNGEDVIAKWVPTEGDKVHIVYININDSSDQHALLNVDNDGYEDNLHLLGSKDWRFGIAQVDGCAVSEYVWVDDGATDGWVLFR